MTFLKVVLKCLIADFDIFVVKVGILILPYVRGVFSHFSLWGKNKACIEPSVIYFTTAIYVYIGPLSDVLSKYNTCLSNL